MAAAIATTAIKILARRVMKIPHALQYYNFVMH